MKGLRTTKLVVGIIMLVLSLFIIFQSSAAGVADAVDAAMGGSNKTASGTAGILVALMYIASGIVMIATHNKDGMGGDIADLIMLALAWLVGICNVGRYSDLAIWSWLALIIGVGAFVWHLVLNKKGGQNTSLPSASQNPTAQTPAAQTK